MHNIGQDSYGHDIGHKSYRHNIGNIVFRHDIGLLIAELGSGCSVLLSLGQPVFNRDMMLMNTSPEIRFGSPIEILSLPPSPWGRGSRINWQTEDFLIVIRQLAVLGSIGGLALIFCLALLLDSITTALVMDHVHSRLSIWQA